MKSNYLLFLSALCLGQANAMSLPNSTIKPYDCNTCESLSHEALSAHWSLDNKALGHEHKNKQVSLRYQIKANLSELKKGVSIHTLAPGAIIRISPSSQSAKTFKPQFVIKKNNLIFSLNDASSLMAKDDALKNSALANDTISISQLKPELGLGEFILSETSAANSQQLDTYYIISVFDKASTTFLSVETDKTHYQYGDELNVSIRMFDDVSSYPIDSIDASLSSTDGESTPLSLKRSELNTYKAQIKLNSDLNPHGENWYVEVNTKTDIEQQPVYRHVHVGFSYAIPSAAITELKKVKSEPFAFSATLNVATPSRYALQAVLYGTNAEGKVEPIETAQAANWLSPGQAFIEFSFPKKIAKQYKSPYYLGSVKLIDYGQLKPVYEFNEPITISKLE